MRILKKDEVSLVPYQDESFELRGHWERKEKYAIAITPDSKIIWNGRASEVTALFTKHDWSGICLVSLDGEVSGAADLYSPYYHVGFVPVRITGEEKELNVEIGAVSKNPLSHAQQLVFHGFLVRSSELPPQFSQSEMSDEEFTSIQAAQFDVWDDSVAERSLEPDYACKLRYAAYAKRVSEALVYAEGKERLLDIGCGYFNEGVVGLFLEKGIEYWAQDINQDVVNSNKRLLTKMGLPPERMLIGENTKFNFDNGSFDFVFSSHCLEHSRDPEHTFREINRLLTPGGKFCFAVPIGWDEGPEHMYSMEVNDWVELTRSAGFKVRSFHVGDVYPEAGWDLFVFSQK